MRRRSIAPLSLSLSALMLLSASVYAGNKSVKMTLRIAVDAPPPCTVTGGTVNFNDVLTTKIDGTNYTQTVGYSLNCDKRIVDALKMQLQGTVVTINGESVLKTNVDGLGVRVRTVNEHTLLEPGSTSWFHFNFSGSDPALEATPVKNSATTLSSGDFTAGATLVVDYQ